MCVSLVQFINKEQKRNFASSFFRKPSTWICAWNLFNPSSHSNLVFACHGNTKTHSYFVTVARIPVKNNANYTGRCVTFTTVADQNTSITLTAYLVVMASLTFIVATCQGMMNTIPWYHYLVINAIKLQPFADQ